MKFNPKHRATPDRRSHSGRMSGMTLLEMTVVILVLLSLISILFVGANAWKKGSDRTLCIMNIRNVQNGIRSFSNLYGYNPGGNVPGLQIRIMGLGKFVEQTPSCPASGAYSYGISFGNDTVPPVGEVYLQCSLSTTANHVPADITAW
ncbi:MAG: hypothetical protein IZT59_00830 [Verrucomicrobia bacterium]|nr:hypothetical protein [Verrucomicrobiota bacterium]